MAASTLDQVLNWAIPLILFLIAFGWLYSKVIKPHVIPLIKDMIEYTKSKSEEREKEPAKIIEYG